MNTHEESILMSEEKLHDRWAHDFDPSQVPVNEFFTTPTCPENIFLMKELGNLKGKKVLELGTGSGEGAVYFAKKGALVVGVDISSEMLQVAQRVAVSHGTSIEVRQMDASHLDFEDASFDIVYGANVLHHVDLAACLKDVKRILKPGGRAAFWDPICYNPIINIYRHLAHQVRSPDEHPLGRESIALMRQEFSDVKVEFFWLATLAIFLRFYFIDQIHPNEERYWKKVIHDYSKFAGTYQFLRKIDQVLLKIPGLKWWAWNMAVILSR